MFRFRNWNWDPKTMLHSSTRVRTYYATHRFGQGLLNRGRTVVLLLQQTAPNNSSMWACSLKLTYPNFDQTIVTVYCDYKFYVVPRGSTVFLLSWGHDPSAMYKLYFLKNLSEDLTKVVEGRTHAQFPNERRDNDALSRLTRSQSNFLWA